MKIIFAGTPHFAAKALETLLEDHNVVAVLTQPDRPSGRGMKLTASPVKHLAQKHNIPVYQPASLKTEGTQQKLVELNADIMIVAAYGLILPKKVLQTPHLGCLNIHASLLPRWRGAAPIQRAILAGDSETGVTIMQMDEGLDTGDMLLKMKCEITGEDTAETLHDKLAELGAAAILETLHKLEQNQLVPERQQEELATYASKLDKAEAKLDWSKDAKSLDREVRAYFPFPVANTLSGGMPIKILRAHYEDIQPETELPGTIISIEKPCIKVACGRGVLALEILQKPGGKPLLAEQFIQGLSLKVGDKLGLD